jgi:hypothetical protein
MQTTSISSEKSPSCRTSITAPLPARQKQHPLMSEALRARHMELTKAIKDFKRKSRQSTRMPKMRNAKRAIQQPGPPSGHPRPVPPQPTLSARQSPSGDSATPHLPSQDRRHLRAPLPTITLLVLAPRISVPLQHISVPLPAEDLGSSAL